jgi:Flp pilus assembly protein TadB
VLVLLLLAIAFGAFVYFGISWLNARRSLNAATKIERWNAAIEDARDREARGPAKSRIRTALRARGWNGSLLPLVTAATLLYALCALALTVIGLPQVFAAIIGVAVAGLTVFSLNHRAYTRRHELFRRQLMQLMFMLATHIKTHGTGPQRSLTQLVPNLDDPLGYELTDVLAQVSASRNLVDALTELSERYPSRAFSMFISTLEMSDTVGGIGIAPALERVATILSKDFELTEEARAEIAQTRAEFYAVTAIVAGICFLLFSKAGSTNAAAFRSPLGLVALTVGFTNYLLGIWRVRRTLAKAKGRD